jgi:hypothetical protein
VPEGFLGIRGLAAPFAAFRAGGGEVAATAATRWSTQAIPGACQRTACVSGKNSAEFHICVYLVHLRALLLPSFS